MATLTLHDGELVLGLSGWEKAGALHGDIRVPLGNVTDVTVSAQPFRDLRGMRAPGAGLPGVIALGTFRYHGGKEFAALYRRKAAVIVSLRDEPFARLLVSAEDPDAIAATITRSSGAADPASAGG